MNLVAELKEKFANKTIVKEIEPRFTPRIGVKTGKPVGAEVSIFWNGRGPDGFMNGAKEAGISNELYKIMVEKALPYIKEALSLNPSLKFSFKLYRLQLESSEPIDELLKLFAEADVPLRNLEFESDLEFAKKGELCREILEKLRRLSITVDFVLETDEEICLPLELFTDVVVSKTKLKRDLIKFLLGEGEGFSFEKGVKFLRATVNFFKELDISVLAAGVDTKAEFDLLAVMGVDEVQGKLFGENLKGEEFISFIKNSA